MKGREGRGPCKEFDTYPPLAAQRDGRVVKPGISANRTFEHAEMCTFESVRFRKYGNPAMPFAFSLSPLPAGTGGDNP